MSRGTGSMTNEDDDVSRGQGWDWDAVDVAAQAWRKCFFVQGDANHRIKPYEWHGIPPPPPSLPRATRLIRTIRPLAVCKCALSLSETCVLPGLLCKLSGSVTKRRQRRDGTCCLCATGSSDGGGRRGLLPRNKRQHI